MQNQQFLLIGSQDLDLSLGPCQLQIMRFFWTRGPATVREIYGWLVTDRPLAYTTVMSTCVRLHKKGLLERRKKIKERDHPGNPYIYLART